MLLWPLVGGQWWQAYWDLLAHCADYTAQHWQETDYGIWELATHAHYVSSKVMSWVVLAGRRASLSISR